MRHINAKIFCVNDELEALDLFDFIITQGGHQTIRALGAAEAHRKIMQERHLDLAIINLLMPMVNWPEPVELNWQTNLQAGYIIARFLRLKFNQLPIIFDSASSAYMPEALALARTFPNSCCLKNPFHVHDLLAKINSALEGKPFCA